MQLDPSRPSPDPGGRVPPVLPSAPPVPGEAPPIIGPVPPALPTPPSGKSLPGRRLLAIVLSLGLALFLAEAVISLLDDSLIVLTGLQWLSGLHTLVFLFSILLGFFIYALMGLTPLVPKRLFLPVSLFNVAAVLAVFPVMIYAFNRMQQAAWLVSLCQVLIAFGILHRLRRSFQIGWPLVPQERLQGRAFSGLNLFLFLLVNGFVLFPAVLAYLAVCASLAIGHFSEGFLALRPGGLSVQARKYVRADGKTIQLVPMAHIGNPSFYHQLAASFPTNSIILMEGVTDENNLLTNRITYQRIAKSLHLSEQQKEFRPPPTQIVRADVDVDQFGTNTIGFLNLAMLVHARGVTAETLQLLFSFAPPPGFEQELLDDLLHKRNQRLLQEVQAQLPEANYLVVPWGAAHMPGISKAITKQGFHLKEVREYPVIRFGGAPSEQQEN